jgi:hypothetical protein
MTRSLAGSCLCRSVSYEIFGPFIRFVYCYCSRCRKLTGSGRASNIVILPEHFRWTHGEEFLVRYDLPKARSFATTFCSRCGSPLPHTTRSGREVIVPAGSLDQEPAERPNAHYQWSSRAKWVSDDEQHLPHVE